MVSISALRQNPERTIRFGPSVSMDRGVGRKIPVAPEMHTRGPFLNLFLSSHLIIFKKLCIKQNLHF